MIASEANGNAVTDQPMVTVVMPCYRVTAHVLEVIAAVGPEVSAIYCVDDACPEGSGALIERQCADPRVRVIRHQANQGVGGATLTGYGAALADGADIIVKIDGDGQMDPADLPRLIAPIAAGAADYTKGNRFFHLEDLRGMPRLRLFGNAALSFLTKLSSGYWPIFDPTNGYTAIHGRVAELLPADKVAKRYFFESDLLFHLGLERATVMDVPMTAHYGDEISNLHIRSILAPYLWGHLRNTALRLFYNYFVRDFSIASLEIVFGVLLLAFGLVHGMFKWHQADVHGIPSTAGTVMLAALPVIVGLQMLFNAVNFDIQNVPRQPLHKLLYRHARRKESS